MIRLPPASGGLVGFVAVLLYRQPLCGVERLPPSCWLPNRLRYVRLKLNEGGTTNAGRNNGHRGVGTCGRAGESISSLVSTRAGNGRRRGHLRGVTGYYRGRKSTKLRATASVRACSRPISWRTPALGESPSARRLEHKNASQSAQRACPRESSWQTSKLSQRNGLMHKDRTRYIYMGPNLHAVCNTTINM